jgi:hypothetical protein
MTIYIADFFSAHTSPAQIRGAGFNGASCYLSHQEGKASIASEIEAFRADGLIVTFGFEDGAGNALGGFVQGQRDAAFAVGQAEALGYPHGCVIAYAVDFQAFASQYSTVVAYFQGCVTESGPYVATDYGSYSVVEVVHAEVNLVGWQTAAWSGGAVSAHAYMVQTVFGNEFDSSHVEFAVPMWGLAPAVPPRPPLPAPHLPANPGAAPTTEEAMDNPRVVVASGPTAGSLGRKVTAGQCYVVWNVGLKTLLPLADAVDFANEWGQRPLPGQPNCSKRSCAALAAIPNR